MKRYFAFIFCSLVLFLSGCASDTEFIKAQENASLAHSKAVSDAANARARSIEAIATSNASDASKAMGFMAMMAAGGTQLSNDAPRIQQPVNQALQWASILVPSTVQAFGIYANKEVSINNSNNAAATAQATTAGFVSIAGKIQAPAANITTTDSHDQNLSGTGTLGSGAYTTTDSHALTTPFVTPIVPVVTTTGTGATTTTVGP